MRTNNVSKKKQKLIKDFENSPLQVGEFVYFKEEACKNYSGLYKNDQYEILSIDGDELTVTRSGYSKQEKHITVNKSDVDRRYMLWSIGADPFDHKYSSVRPVAYNMDSIIFMFELDDEPKRDKPYEFNGIEAMELNWNPYVYLNGEKKYYQRDFVWTKKQEQLLIESIYKGISCGTILVRKHQWKEIEKKANNGETELSFSDIVDGKQRLNTIRRFIQNKFKDLHGNYFADLSNKAQHDFTNHQLFSYAEMNNVTDDETLFQFLKLNHAGVPQSKEHIDFVTSLLKN